MSLRRKIRYSDHWLARCARALYYLPGRITLPLPPSRMLVTLFSIARDFWWTFKRVFIAEPFFKSYCTRYGRNLRTGVFLHWMMGKGEMIVGDNVTIDGKCTFKFAARYTERPRLVIGSNTGISHGCTFAIGKEITIGEHCRLAGGSFFFDAPGHPNDPELRKRGAPAPEEAVKPIHIGNNVWIGRNCSILPGVTIGDNAIISTGSVVFTDVPANAIVAGNPARVTGHIAKDQAHASATSEQDQSKQPQQGGVPVETSVSGGLPCPSLQSNPVPPAAVPAAKSLVEDVLRLIEEVGDLDGIGPEDDIYDQGLNSMSSVVLMIRIEQEFDISIPDIEFPELRTAVQLASAVAGARKSDEERIPEEIHVPELSDVR